MKFKKALVMGTGRLPFQCALRLGGFFDQADICVLEIKLPEVSVLEKLCMNHQISYACLSKTQIEERLRGISEPTLVVSAVNTYLFQPWFLQQEHITTINYHNALLPRHRGRNVESWAIFDGDEETGITWHFVDAGVDTGRVIDQRAVCIEPDMTAISLLKRQNQMAAEAFDSFIGLLLEGELRGSEQARSKENTLHYSQELPNNGWLDMQWSLDKMSRFLRAMDYGAIMTLGHPMVALAEQGYKIVRYELAAEGQERETGPREELRPGQLTIREGGKRLCLQLEPGEDTIS